MEEENKLPPEELEQEEQKKEAKEQKQEENKRTLKTVIISVICTLLFIIILLLLVILGMNRCTPNNNGVLSSSEQPSGPKYDYDTVSLNEKFKAIVKGYMDGPGGMDPDNITEVKSVTYVDNYDDGNFSLNISVTSESNKLYVYKAYKAFYPEDKSGFDNLISYLLLDTTPNVFVDGDPLETEFSCNTFIPTAEVITTDEQCKYVISNNIAGTIKYFDGFYFDNNQYHVYHHQEYNVDTNPFTKQADIVVDLDHPLYGYYQSLLK